MSGKRGRPTTYTPEIAAEIVERVAAGESLRAVCEDEDMPPESTVRSWAIDNREGFFAQYARAQDIRAHSLFDQIIEIADDSSRDTYEDENGNERVNTEVVQRARLRVDARKWYIGKVMPKVYGERVAMEHSGPNGGPIQTEDVTELSDAELLDRASKLGGRLAGLLPAKANGKNGKRNGKAK